MATYGVRVINTETGAKAVYDSKLTKEEAITKKNELKALIQNNDFHLTVQVFIEMNMHEKMVSRLIQYAVSELIGGRENTLLDYPEDSEEYQTAKACLNHDELFAEIYDYVMMESKGNYASHIRFAGKQFIEDRIDARLVNEGYGKDE